MHAPHVAADLPQRLDRIARAVEDHVGRIEIHEQIVALHRGEEGKQRVGRLLAGLQMHPLPLPAAMVAKLARDGEHLPIERVGGVVRDEAEVQPDRIDAQEPGEIGDFLHFHQPRGPGLRRNQADGPRHGGDVGVALALEPAEDDADADAQFAQPGEELLGPLGRPARFLRSVKLNRGHAQLAGDVQAARPVPRRCWQRLPKATFPCSTEAVAFAVTPLYRFVRPASGLTPSGVSSLSMSNHSFLKSIRVPLPGGHVGRQRRSPRRPGPPWGGNGAVLRSGLRMHQAQCSSSSA